MLLFFENVAHKVLPEERWLGSDDSGGVVREVVFWKVYGFS